jgi:signal transduction histidine kinase
MIESKSVEGTGLDVVDLYSVPGFAERHRPHHDASLQMERMRRVAQGFVENPATILQELVSAAIDMFGADSAGISMQDRNPDGTITYRWVATAGEYAPFLNAVLPEFPSACRLCLERERPQLFTVSQQFFDLLGVQAATITDGILIPWRVEEQRGTIWVAAHGRTEAFDSDDSRMLELLANFAAMAVRQQRLQEQLIRQAAVESAAAMANELAHKINNPLQALINVIYLAAEGESGKDSHELGHDLMIDLVRLSDIVQELLALPGGKRPPAVAQPARDSSVALS